MKTEKTIVALNNLIEANNWRIETYNKASTATLQEELIHLFFALRQTSITCNVELHSELLLLEVKPSKNKEPGNILDINSKNSNTDLHLRDLSNLLDTCQTLENDSLDAYSHVLNTDGEYLTHELQTLFFNHFTLLKADQIKLKTLRDKLIPVEN